MGDVCDSQAEYCSFALWAVLSAGCSGDGGDESEATATPTRTEYPLTITDMLGREVTIPAAPVRIAALSQTTIDYVYALGAESVVRPAGVTEPPAVGGLPEFGLVELPLGVLGAPDAFLTPLPGLEAISGSDPT